MMQPIRIASGSPTQIRKKKQFSQFGSTSIKTISTIYNSSIDFDHFDILASDANKFRLLIKVSLLIKRDQPQLNKTIKSFSLKLFDRDLR